MQLNVICFAVIFLIESAFNIIYLRNAKINTCFGGRDQKYEHVF